MENYSLNYTPKVGVTTGLMVRNVLAMMVDPSVATSIIEEERHQIKNVKNEVVDGLVVPVVKTSKPVKKGAELRS